jgi:predicted transcriptional regulator
LLKPRFEKFWDNLKKEIYSQRIYVDDVAFVVYSDEYLTKTILETLEEHNKISINELSSIINVDHSQCRKAVNKLISDGKIIKEKTKNRYCYSLK